MQLIVSLAARVSSWPTLPPLPPATLDCTGTPVHTGPAPMPAPRLRPARTQPASATISTPQVDWLVPGRGLHPFLLPGGGPLSNCRAHRAHHLLTHLTSRRWRTRHARDLISRRQSSRGARVLPSLSRRAGQTSLTSTAKPPGSHCDCCTTAG